MGALRPWHVAILVVVLVLLFGAKRLPDAARSLGRSMRILKAETKGLAEDDVQGKAEAQTGHRSHGLKAPGVRNLAKVEMDGYTILHRSWVKVGSATHLRN